MRGSPCDSRSGRGQTRSFSILCAVSRFKNMRADIRKNYSDLGFDTGICLPSFVSINDEQLYIFVTILKSHCEKRIRNRPVFFPAW